MPNHIRIVKFYISFLRQRFSIHHNGCQKSLNQTILLRACIHKLIYAIVFAASINSLACPLGGLLCGYILDKVGRKKTLIIINLFSITSWGILALANQDNVEIMYIQLLMSRFLIGITTGLSSSPAAVYSAEIAQPNLRGRLTILTTLAVGLGILIIYVLGYFIPDNWRLVSAIACFISVFSLIVLIYIPESPTWLISKKRFDDAELSLNTLRGVPLRNAKSNHAVLEELNLLKDKIIYSNNNPHTSIYSMLKQKQVYKPLGIMIGFFAFQQFSGIFVIIVYAVQFTAEVGVLIDPFLCTVLIGIIRVIATVMVGYVLDSVGRKPPSIFSGIGMSICMFGLTICMWLPNFTQNISWLPLFLILTFIFTSTIGYLTIPFTMSAEIYPLKIRGFATGLTICMCYLMCFIVVKLYPTMIIIMGCSNVMLFFGLVSILGVLYVHFILPETKGKSLEEIEDYFKYDKQIYLNVNKV